MMEIEVNRSNSPVFVSVRGVLNAAGGKELEQRVRPLLEEAGHSVMVDLAGVPRIDSQGLSTLVNLSCRSNTRGGRLAFARLNLFVSEVVRVTQLHRFLTLVDDLE